MGTETPDRDDWIESNEAREPNEPREPTPKRVEDTDPIGKDDPENSRPIGPRDNCAKTGKERVWEGVYRDEPERPVRRGPPDKCERGEPFEWEKKGKE